MKLKSAALAILLLSPTAYADAFDSVGETKPDFASYSFALTSPRLIIAERRAQEQMTRARTYAASIVFAGASVGLGLYFGLRRKTTSEAKTQKTFYPASCHHEGF